MPSLTCRLCPNRVLVQSDTGTQRVSHTDGKPRQAPSAPSISSLIFPTLQYSRITATQNGRGKRSHHLVATGRSWPCDPLHGRRVRRKACRHCSDYRPQEGMYREASFAHIQPLGVCRERSYLSMKAEFVSFAGLRRLRTANPHTLEPVS